VVAPELPRTERWEPEPRGHMAAPGAAPSREVRAGAGAVGTRGSPGAALSREVGTGVVGTRGGPGAVPSWEAGTGASGHVGTRVRLVLCLDLELVRGSTRSSGYRQRVTTVRPGAAGVLQLLSTNLCRTT
jgi:hypothetical protein